MFTQGVSGCDNLIAHKAHISGLQLINPCQIIKCNHLHLVPHKTYSTKDRIGNQGTYIYIEPTDALAYSLNDLSGDGIDEPERIDGRYRKIEHEIKSISDFNMGALVESKKEEISIICKKEWQGCYTLAKEISKQYEGFKAYTPEEFSEAKLTNNTILFVGAGDDQYNRIMRNHKGRMFFYWSHTLTKSELSSSDLGVGVEFSQLSSIVNKMGWHGIEKIFVTSKGLAELHSQFEYLPTVLPEEQIKTQTTKIDQSVGCFLEPAIKKNIATQLCAIKLAGCTALMHSGIPKYAQHLIDTLGISVKLCDTSYFTREPDKYFQNLSAVEVNVQVTPSEEASYTATESILCGVPCIVGPSSVLSGISNEFDELCVVNKIDEPLEISDKINKLRTNKELRDKSLELGMECIRHVNATNSEYVIKCFKMMREPNEKYEEMQKFVKVDDSHYEQLKGMTGDPFDYYKTVDAGFTKMKERKFAICGIARDCEGALKEIMIPRVEELISHVGDYHICIFENDSKISSGDDTAKVLQEWGSKHQDKSHIVCEELNIQRVGGTSSKRTNNLAIHRNKYLTYIYENFRHFDYMVVFDWDLTHGFSINGIAHSIETFDHVDKWGAITATAVNGRYQYYDAFTYREVGNFAKYNGKILRASRVHGGRKIGSDIVRIGSGFNALTIYDMKALCDTVDKQGPASGNGHSKQFGNLYGDNINCEHVRVHAALDKCGYSVWLNPSLVVHY